MSRTQSDRLAVDGGTPVRATMLPYGRQVIEDDDIAAVVEALRSDWLTTGPMVGRFEEAFAEYVGSRHAVAVSNGTAALHASMHALGITAGDEVIVPTMTFAATANSVVYMGGRPVFADVDPDSLLLDADRVEGLVTERTRAIAAVDYAGQTCDYDALRALAERHGIALVDDASHSVGATWRGAAAGTLADLNTFSLHPVKHFTTGEGGLVTTDDDELARRMRVFRNHGITTDHRQREAQGSWYYEMQELGFNYRLTDFQCALGISQLRKVPGWVARRREIAQRYDEAFAGMPSIRPLSVLEHARPAYHLYVVRFDLKAIRLEKAQLFSALRGEGIGVNVHYVPVHLHPFYRRSYGTGPGLCPVAEKAYEEIVSLPIFPSMTDQDITDVIEAVRKVCGTAAERAD